MARPKAFDPNEALTQAMLVFWQKGYEATSVAELTAAMGINKFSLYSSFGDKRAVFLKALAHYRQTIAADQFTCLQPASGLKALETFFARLTDAANPFRGQGCLMVNSLVDLTGQDPEIDKEVRSHFKWVENHFAAALMVARDKGEVATALDVKMKARSLITLVHGVMTLGKAPFGRPVARAAVEDAFASIRRQSTIKQEE